jgi:hypothetical protein
MPPSTSARHKEERQHKQLEEILALCQEYVAAGWMTEQQWQTYQRILHQHPDTLEYIAKDIQSSVTKVQRTRDSKPKAVNAKSRCIYLPEEFHQVHATSSSDASLKELFVEMCFYARLGYVQPPCCLKCAYQNSSSTTTTSADAATDCQRWVVWRRDANDMLHPDTLPDNVVFLPCFLAQQLLRSPNQMLRDGYVWDPTQKQLIQSSTTIK